MKRTVLTLGPIVIHLSLVAGCSGAAFEPEPYASTSEGATAIERLNVSPLPGDVCVDDDDCKSLHTVAGVSICSGTTHRCEVVDPRSIACGGFVAHPHECPVGYFCRTLPAPDVGGFCARMIDVSALTNVE